MRGLLFGTRKSAGELLNKQRRGLREARPSSRLHDSLLPLSASWKKEAQSTKEHVESKAVPNLFWGLQQRCWRGFSTGTIVKFTLLHLFIHPQFASLWRTYSSSIVRKPREFDELTPVRVIGVTLVRSGAHQPPDIRKNLKALKLYKMHQTVYHPNIACIRGIIHKVQIRLPLAQSHFTVRCDSSSN